MSTFGQPVRVTITKTAEETVTADDRADVKVRLRPVLPPGRMKELVADALGARGWTQQADGRMAKTCCGGEERAFDLETMTVSAAAAASETIKKTASGGVSSGGAPGPGWGCGSYPDCPCGRRIASEMRQTSRESVERSLEDQVRITDAERAEARRRLQDRASGTISRSEQEREREINEVVKDVYAQALKERAASLGQVTRVEERESGGRFDMEIEVEL